VPPLPDVPPEKRWQHERKTLGFVLSVHPLRLYRDAIRNLKQPVVAARDLDRHVGRSVWLIGWPITYKEVMTKEREPMEFFSFEDETAIFETVFFPREYARFCQHLDMTRAYLLYGKVESEYGAVTITIKNLRRLSNPRAHKRRRQQK
jgi:error-prone DNA polymerase